MRYRRLRRPEQHYKGRFRSCKNEKHAILVTAEAKTVRRVDKT